MVDTWKLASETRPTRREQVGWSFYDWANSAFPTTVIAVFLGPYLTTIAKAAADSSGFIYPLGIPVRAGSFFPYVVSLAALLQVISLPIVGAVADYSRRKKPMLALFAYVGALATMAMYFLQGSQYLLGGVLFIIANVSFGASVVVYNAFLPEVADPRERDSVSSMGWALGYLGGGLLLAMNLVLFSRASAFGLSTGHAVRISLASAGVWWAIFTIIPLLTLRRRQPVRLLPAGERYLTIGLQQLGQTLAQATRYPQTLLFLVAYLFYNDGIQTVIALSSQFGQEELGLPVDVLIQAILMAQFVAFFGAIGLSYLAKPIGTKRAIIVSLAIWIGALIFAYGFTHTKTDFFILAGVIALVLGGSQALSRSLYSLTIPTDQAAEYFSLYEVSERGTSWLGPLLVGLAFQLTGSYRISIISLVVFFLVGIIMLAQVNVRRAAVEVGNEAPSS